MISVILPIYNVEKYIGACMNSLLTQKSQNFEIILVNDGTKDHSCEVADSILKKGNLPYKIINKENRGVSAARNTGIAAAVGEYVIMVDSDDVLSDSFISDFEDMVRTYPAQDIFFCDYQVVDENHVGIFDNTYGMLQLIGCEEAQRAFLRRKIRFLLPAMLLKRSFLLVHQKLVFDESVRYSEDVQYIWRALAYTEENIVYLPKKNYNYILHSGSTMTASSVTKILTGCDGIRRLYAEIQSKLSSTVSNEIVCKWYFAMLHGAAKMMDQKTFFELYVASGSSAYMKDVRRYSSLSVKVVVTALLFFDKAGYILLRKF